MFGVEAYSAGEYGGAWQPKAAPAVWHWGIAVGELVTMMVLDAGGIAAKALE